MSVFDRLLGRSAQVAARELLVAANGAAPELMALMDLTSEQARAAAALLAKLCFDRAAAAGGRGQGPLKAGAEASAILYPAIGAAMRTDAARAGQCYIELADVVRRRLESRPPAIAGAQIVAEELARAVSPPDTMLEMSPALIGRVDALIKSFNAILMRHLGAPASRRGGRTHGS